MGGGGSGYGYSCGYEFSAFNGAFSAF